ncbi:MAG: hypothetical protein WCS52_19250 [bacterium]
MAPVEPVEEMPVTPPVVAVVEPVVRPWRLRLGGKESGVTDSQNHKPGFPLGGRAFPL